MCELKIISSTPRVVKVTRELQDWTVKLVTQVSRVRKVKLVLEGTKEQEEGRETLAIPDQEDQRDSEDHWDPSGNQDQAESRESQVRLDLMEHPENLEHL